MGFNLDDLRGMTQPDEAGCWIWQRGRGGPGYGMLYHKESEKVVYAHRLVAELTMGPCPEGKEVMHSCDVRACINPDHLSYGTRADNVADMLAKGRGSKVRPQGEAHWKAKLSVAQVLEIRTRRAQGELLRTLAEDYGVTIANIHLIATRKKWQHV